MQPRCAGARRRRGPRRLRLEAGSSIHCGDRSAMRSERHAGTTSGPSREALFVRAACRRLFRNMISGIPPGGRVRFEDPESAVVFRAPGAAYPPPAGHRSLSSRCTPHAQGQVGSELRRFPEKALAALLRTAPCPPLNPDVAVLENAKKYLAWKPSRSPNDLGSTSYSGAAACPPPHRCRALSSS
jgi:hypothetical protein